jgi:type II secretory pathway component GspD/PulD (secretin)
MRANVNDGKPLALGANHNEMSARRMQALHKRIRTEQRDEFPSNSRMGSAVSIDFQNKSLGDAIEELRALSGLNIIVDTTALSYAGVDEKAPVSLKLNGVSMKTALSALLQKVQLTYYVKNSLIYVSTPEVAARETTKTRHYAVHDLITPRDDMAQLANQNPDAAPVAGNANMSPFLVNKSTDGYNGPSNSGGVGTLPGEWNRRRTGQTLERQLEHLITSSIAPETWKVNGQGGQGTIQYYPIGMTFVISQPNDVQEQIDALMRRLRELQEVQITVEVRILTLTDDFFERMGVDFNVLIPDKQTAFDRQVAAANFAPAGLLNTNDHLKGVVVGLTPNGNFTNNLDIPISNDSFRQARLGTGFAGIGPPGSAGGLDLGVAFLSSIQVFLVMEAVQGDVRNSTLQAPKVTLFNGQVASIASFRQELFVTAVNAIPNFFTGIPVFVPVQQAFQTGVFLTLQAVVTHDRRYVQLTLSPVITRVEDSGRSFQSVAGITLQQPVTSTITVATTVMVPDGGTILVGGLKTMSEQRREFGPPILSKIPYINRLFRNQSYGKAASSLMFMVTPRIIINEEEEEKLGNTFSF